MIIFFDKVDMVDCLLFLYRWTTQRKVFGKPLHSQAVIRSKLAGMISRAESVYRFASRLFCNFPDRSGRHPKLAREHYISNVQHGN